MTVIKLNLINCTSVQLTCCYKHTVKFFSQVTQFFTNILVFNKQITWTNFSTNGHKQIQIVNKQEVYTPAIFNLQFFQVCSNIIYIALCWHVFDLQVTCFLAHHFNFHLYSVQVFKYFLSTYVSEHTVNTHSTESFTKFQTQIHAV